MTANELAEALDYIGEHYYAGWGNVMFKDAAIFVKKQAEQIELLQNDIIKQQEFVCQQAQEIEALKKELALQKLSDIGQEIETLDTRSYLIGRYDGLRELTDEEITEIGLAHGAFFTESKHRLWGDDLEIHDFARAILKKAGEK